MARWTSGVIRNKSRILDFMTGPLDEISFTEFRKGYRQFNLC